MIDYSNGTQFLSIRPELETTITSAAQQAAANVEPNTATLLYYLPKEKALEFDLT